MMRRKRKKYIEPPRKVVARLNPDQWRRANLIKSKYGFRSIYEISQYLWGAFLRVADPDNDDNTDPVPDEIELMFSDYSQAEKRFEYVKPKRRLPQREIDEINGQMPIKFES